MSLYVKRTESSGPPPGLLFGEVAYSDGDQKLYVGRADEAESPTTFDSNPTDYGPAIAALTLDVATLETSQAGQDTAIASLAIDVAALDAAPPPITGWDYIGPTEPIGPAVGFTWWETPEQNQWYWSGSVWLGLVTHWDSIDHPAGLAITDTTTGPQLSMVLPSFGPTLITEVVFDVLQFNGVPDINNYWNVSAQIENLEYGTISSTLAANTLTALNSLAISQTIKIPNSIIDTHRIRLSLEKVGNAPLIVRASMRFSWRQVR